jgi:hypothetical protein
MPITDDIRAGWQEADELRTEFVAFAKYVRQYAPFINEPAYTRKQLCDRCDDIISRYADSSDPPPDAR